MSEEKLRILKMIQEGKLSPQEGLELLETLQEYEIEEEQPFQEKSAAPPAGEKSKLRIRVSDTHTGKVKVNLSVPAGLISRLPFLMPKEAKEATRGMDFKELMAGLQSGETGEKLVDVYDEEDGEHVEIFFE